MTATAARQKRANPTRAPGTHRSSARRFPSATYRLQFNRQFTFRQALTVSEYLSELGISDCYASPLLEASPQSTHGYDVCGFEHLSTQLGNENDFEAWSRRLKQLGMGLVLDIVPNHMAASFSNSLWRDVLAQGLTSPFARWFDIDWQRADKNDRPKILLPVLEAHYGKVLEAGKLKIIQEEGTFVLSYGENRFPLSPDSLLKFGSQLKGDLDRFNGRVGEPSSFDSLDELIQSQHYRLAYWRAGLEELNYRRFFDVTGLIGLRVELPEVFHAAHAGIFRWAWEGRLSGLRVDHPDGLWDPKDYFRQLRQGLRRAGKGKKQGQAELYMVAEKILTGDEPLPEDWPVDGTTGYDFLNQVNGLFVNGRNGHVFDMLYSQFTGCSHNFSAVVLSSKRLVLEALFQSELNALARRLERLAAQTRDGVDFTMTQLRAALSEILVALPVYRTYITAETAQEDSSGLHGMPLRSEEEAWLDEAVRAAEKINPTLDKGVFDWLQSVLLLKPLRSFRARAEELRREFVMRFQQLTGPLMAKGLEDTAFYRFNRLVSLNEVGGAPERFGMTAESFHQHNLLRARRWPHSMLATATHDTKRGEDLRARLNVLSEMPEEWREAVRRWHELNADKRTLVAGEPAPHPNDEYLLYQTLVGAWVPEAETSEGLKAFAERITAFMSKAVKEAKVHTSWLESNGAYEGAVRDFVSGILSQEHSDEFLRDLRGFHRRIAFFGQFNSFSQTLVKLTAPGVPDIYQGTELWDYNLVDPDNRRPVDFEERQNLLAGLKEKVASSENDLVPLLEQLLADSATGEIKLYVLWRVLNFRRAHRDLFDEGDYRPLKIIGDKREHVCGFARRRGEQELLTVVPRLVLGLTGGVERSPMGDVWQDTVLEVPTESRDAAYRNVFTGKVVKAKEGSLSLRDVLRHFPVALMEKLT